MKNKRSIQRFALFLLIPLVALFFAPAAKAEPTMPPTEECIAQVETMLLKWKEINKKNDYVTDDQERALWKPVVDAGCLKQNPIKSIKATKKCNSYWGQVSSYLAPANAAMRPFSKRLNALERNYLRTTESYFRKIYRAEKQGMKKKARALKRKNRMLNKSFRKSSNKIVADSAATVDQYVAPVFLVYADVYTRGCEFTIYRYKKNAPAFLTMGLWDIKK